MKIQEIVRNKRFLLAGIVCAEMVICCNISSCGKAKGEYLQVETEVSTEEETQTSASTEESADAASADTGESAGGLQAGDSLDKTIVVYICGEVRYPDVYTFDHAARLCEAIDAAGGFTENAGENYWNLAMVLTDSQMIYVPTKEEAEAYKQLGLAPTDVVSANYGTSGSDEGSAGASSAGGTAGGSTTTGSSGKVNINTADKATLMTIPGIGETRAQSILDYRQSAGSFTKIEDITKVSGIKEATFAKIEDYITVD